MFVTMRHTSQSWSFQVTGPFPALIPLPGSLQRSPETLAGLKGSIHLREGRDGKGKEGERRGLECSPIDMRYSLWI